MMWIKPDQLITLGARVNREWGVYGYSIVGLRGDSSVAIATVRHFDGSEFEIACDQYGNTVELASQESA